MLPTWAAETGVLSLAEPQSSSSSSSWLRATFRRAPIVSEATPGTTHARHFYLHFLAMALEGEMSENGKSKL